jgi:methionyl-tRNA synthetase
MTIRKLTREDLDHEPHDVRFKDIYPWDEIAETPFSASLAVVEPGGRTMLHDHAPAETFVICRGTGTMTVAARPTPVGSGDVVYNPPHTPHELRNDSTTEDLVFVSIVWDPDTAIEPRALRTPRLIVPSPPTANGPLHVGHLAGPYLIADIVRRYYRARGVPASFVCLMDEHQSYVLDRALAEGLTAPALAATYSDQIAQTLALVGATPDECIFPSRDDGYRARVRERFAKLLAAGRLESRTVDTWFCERCDLDLYDSFAAGKCPHCGSSCFGFICDACAQPNRTFDLVDPICDRCKQPPSTRSATKLFFDLKPYLDSLAAFHRQLRASPKLRRLAARWLAALDVVPASQISRWGIPVGIDGFDGQVISPWFEVALAMTDLKDRGAADSELLQFFGYDNAFLYLIHDPAISLALDPAAPLPRRLVANEFLLVGDAKMSTSSGRSLPALALLAVTNVDLLRLYLARVRPEDSRTSYSPEAGHLYMSMVSQYWQSWFARLGESLGPVPAATAPPPATASAWSAEQTEFLLQLKGLLARARRGYETASLKDVMFVIDELVNRASTFGATQAELASVPSLAPEQQTALALELAALRTFAIIVAPVMPGLGERLWQCLGYQLPIVWLDEILPIPAGQPIATDVLVARQWFPLPAKPA